MSKYGDTKIDVSFGAAWGNVISAFILIVTAATLHQAGIFVENAKDAALALEPLAGKWAGLLFSVGLLGASLLAVSVLPLSTTYAMSEAFGFERGLNRRFKEAPFLRKLCVYHYYQYAHRSDSGCPTLPHYDLIPGDERYLAAFDTILDSKNRE